MVNVRSKIGRSCETLRTEFQSSCGHENLDMLHRLIWYNNIRMESLILITSDVSAGYDNRQW